jgi:hypothetical protein
MPCCDGRLASNSLVIVIGDVIYDSSAGIYIQNFLSSESVDPNERTQKS